VLSDIVILGNNLYFLDPLSEKSSRCIFVADDIYTNAMVRAELWLG
jgi:hypothetical protein